MVSSSLAFDDFATFDQDLLIAHAVRSSLVREVYPSIFENPASLLRKGDNRAFAVEEEEVFGVGNREGSVG